MEGLKVPSDCTISCQKGWGCIGARWEKVGGPGGRWRLTYNNLKGQEQAIFPSKLQNGDPALCISDLKIG